MNDLQGRKSIGSTSNTDYFIDDPDILIVVPKAKMVDNPADARINAEYQTKYAQSLGGKKCGVVVVMANLLAQDAETRKVYSEEMSPAVFYGAALVVSNPLSRAIGSFFIGLSRPAYPTKLFDSIESAIEWLKAIRPA